jgi:dethiobiotin synthetase
VNHFITGTGTAVGKTYVTRLLLESLTRLKRTAVGFKPICCGDRDDAQTLRAASVPEPASLDAVNPVYFKSPAAPMAAALIENRPVDLAAIRDTYQNLAAQHDHILTEGAGGWEVPIAPGYFMSDLATELGAPVLLVVDNKLGALSDTILAANAIRARGLELAGLVLNHIAEERDAASISNRSLLEDILAPPLIIDLLHGETEIDWPF